MADTQKFDIYDDKGTKIIDAQPSPITITGLAAKTTYKAYKASYAGAAAQTTLDDIVTKDATTAG